MRILVIGSYGFIGKSLARFIQEKEGYELHECDVVAEYGKANYHIIDATNADYHSIFQSIQFDACINCSGAASVPDSILHPLRDFTLNTYNVFKLLDAIRLYQPGCRFINLSSAAVYGNPQELPIVETFAPAPISPYGIHKMQAEQICSMFHEQYKIPTCSLRIFSAYGPGLKKQLFWDLAEKAKKSDSIMLFGTGNETRDFIYIDDVVQAIFCCLNAARCMGEHINVANGEAITIHTAVNTLLQFFTVTKSFEFNGSVKAGDPLYWEADVSLLKSMGYRPAFSLQDGLKNYYTWISKL
ncbi:NAD-dependent epimerase/dehydratase family protein [Dyadobacter sandarakinus]|uniref:NAD-dependent epimerase/dehydratase family protein n=1 Tax=Dyadobacter sandarakinus TaxID=2747268 RepID=A0ABX7IEU0_9BACT|nr:NAD-dependent epimerase/dehydratase family protein [Dyadobacter sandarakinus]QRR03396.1 NAD-dependent epimerase/dehydratase family protein [Dyadobacter sandarakinus]